MHHDGGIRPEPSSTVVRIAKSNGIPAHLDMEHPAGLHPGMEFGRADAGQSAAHSPRTDDVAPLGWSRVPTLPHPHDLAFVPCLEVDPAAVDTVDQQFAPTGEALMAIDHIKDEVHE